MFRRALYPALIVLTAPVWLPFGLLVALVRVIQKATLYAVVWFLWIGRAHRRVLFVYSNSPNWKEYIEREILPRLPANTVVLNWSERARWPRLSVPVELFHCFTGQEEFNPIALVFDRYRFVEQYRFWKPLRDLKHGHPEALRQLEERLVQRVASWRRT